MNWNVAKICFGLTMSFHISSATHGQDSFEVLFRSNFPEMIESMDRPETVSQGLAEEQLCQNISETEMRDLQIGYRNRVLQSVIIPEEGSDHFQLWLDIVTIDEMLSGLFLSEATAAMEESEYPDCRMSLLQAEIAPAIILTRQHSTGYLKQLMQQDEFWNRLSDRDVRRAFFYTVQHSDHDPDFQMRILAELVLLPQDHPQYHSQFPALVDRLLSDRRGVQRYGTISSCENSRGHLSVPVEDPSGLLARRAEFGMASLEAQLEATCQTMRSGQESVVGSQ